MESQVCQFDRERETCRIVVSGKIQLVGTAQLEVQISILDGVENRQAESDGEFPTIRFRN